jgi:alpha-tubulin suppressor-like RCC1 family protein
LNGLQVQAIGAGANHMLAKISDRTLRAWGLNGYGQLGIGSSGGNSNVPLVVGGPLYSDYVDGGFFHSLALDQVGGYCWNWGYNIYGQLGIGDIYNRYSPVQPLNLLNTVIAVSAGFHHNLAIKNTHEVYAWGGNCYGQIGNGSVVDQWEPGGPILTDVVAIAAGGYHSLALTTNGNVYAWGLSNYGQVGNGSTWRSYVPVLVLTNASAIFAGSFNSFAIKNDGTVWAWGYNGYGQLGDGTYGCPIVPKEITSLSYVTSKIASGNFHTLVLKTDGSVWAMGNNDYGQLGIGTTGGNYTVPVRVSF